jgi:hypothetical protein
MFCNVLCLVPRLDVRFQIESCRTAAPIPMYRTNNGATGLSLKSWNDTVPIFVRVINLYDRKRYDSSTASRFTRMLPSYDGHAVEALRYKPAGRGFDSRWCHWNYSLTWSFLPRYGPGVDSTSNRCISWGGRCVRLTPLPHSCAVWPEVCEL